MKVLLTGAGSPGGAGIIQALLTAPDIELQVADMNPNATGRFLTLGKFHQVPKAIEPEFIPIIMKICREEEIDILLPLVTMELFKLSQYKDVFLSQGTKVIVSDYNALSLANSKCNLYLHLKNNGISTPVFHIVETARDLEIVANMLGYPNKPVVMKPCIGNGSRGIRVLDGKIDRFDLLFNHKPNSLYSTLDEVLAIVGKKQIPKLIVSEYLPGEELTIDTLVKNGSMLICLIRTRKTMNNGISTSGTFIDHSEVRSYIGDIIRVLPKLEGPVGFQVKRSENDGKFLILESNPRIQGTSVASMGLNINFPLQAIYMSLGKEEMQNTKTSGISFSRYYKEVFYEC